MEATQMDEVEADRKAAGKLPDEHERGWNGEQNVERHVERNLERERERADRPELTAVIPLFNESSHIRESLVKIDAVLRRHAPGYEMLVVDDGSTDGTWERIGACAPDVGGLQAIRLSRNFGKELALCAGLEHARGRGVLVMDGDLQHPPSLVAEMIRLWRDEGFDVVEGVKRNRGEESFRNKWGSKLFYALLTRWSGFALDGASDFKLLDEKVVAAWRRLPERNTFFRGMSAWLGFRRTQVPFEVESRPSGASNWNGMALLRLAVNAIVSFSSIPLRLVSVLGAIFLVVAAVLGLQTLWSKLQGDAVTGFTTVILLQLLIGSIIMISLGIIGEYIASIYHEVKGRPRYVIQERMSGAERGRTG